MNKNIIKLIVLTLIVFMPMGFALAANWYVMDGASGNGTSWTNAWDNTSDISGLSSGDTVYIAEGSYGTLTCSTSNVTYKRATTSDHGTDNGWSDSMDGLVALSGRLDINADGVTVDGKTEYGIKITGGSSNGAIDIYGDYDNNTIQYVETDGSQEPGGECYWRGIRIHDSYGGGYVDNTTLSHVYMHNYYNDCMKHVNAKNTLIEHSTFGVRSGSCDQHGDMMEVFHNAYGMTFRYNHVDWNGQQIFFGNGSTSNNWKVYGNVFHSGPTAGKGLHVKDTTGTTATNFILYNNTFYDLKISHRFTSRFTGTSKNNLYYDTGSRGYGGLSSSYDFVVTTNPFTDATNNDFSLTVATPEGDSLGTEYMTDIAGNQRGADGYLDVGAYEYDSGSPPVTPTPPQNIIFIN